MLEVEVRYPKGRSSGGSELQDTVTFGGGTPTNVKQHGGLRVLVVDYYHVINTVHSKPACDTQMQGSYLGGVGLVT